jgi:ankyrin repeat protein
MKDKNSDTPLNRACFMGYLDIIEILLGNRADVNLYDKDGWASLHSAGLNGHIKVVQAYIRQHPPHAQEGYQQYQADPLSMHYVAVSFQNY